MTKTQGELRDKYLGVLALAISKHGLKPDDAYEALSIVMDEALSAAEKQGYVEGLAQGFVDGSRAGQREGEKMGIERAANELSKLQFALVPPATNLEAHQVVSWAFAEKHLRSLAQGGE